MRRDAYGAEVTVVAGGRGWFCCLNPAASYLCSNDARCQFGLGSVASIDEIRVVWPDGATEIFPGGAADRFVVLRKREGVAAPDDRE